MAREHVSREIVSKFMSEDEYKVFFCESGMSQELAEQAWKNKIRDATTQTNPCAESVFTFQSNVGLVMLVVHSWLDAT